MQSTGWQKVGQDLATEQYTYTYLCVCAYITQLSMPKVWLNYSICAFHIRKKNLSVCLYLKGNNAFFLN